MISVLVPTRGRVQQLDTMLSSLFATASDRSNVEIVARIDEDDRSTLNYLLHRGDAKVICKPRVGYALNARMVNECAAESTGDLLLVANDDLVFETQDWDRKLEAAAARYQDGMFDLGVDTVLNNENFCFPCTSRKVVDLFGCFFDDRLLYPDIWMRDVMSPFERAVRVPEVVIRHAWQGMTEDQQSAVGITQETGYWSLYCQCVEEGRAKVRSVLEFVGVRQ